MWATLVNRDGMVCAVAFTGRRGDQWPGSRVISAQKANTANAFSLPGNAGFGCALSSANLYASSSKAACSASGSRTPSTPASPTGGSSLRAGERPMVGRKIGGVNVFGGGFALYKTAAARWSAGWA